MSTSLRRTLIELDFSGKVAFQSAPKLATAIKNDKAAGNSFASLKSLVSNVTGILAGTRTCSDRMQEVITAAAFSAVSDWSKKDRSEFLAMLDEAFEKHASEMRPRKYGQSEKHFENLLSESKKARVHFILTSDTAETSKNEEGRQLQTILIDRLGLANGASHFDTRYIFCFPTFVDAKRYWGKLFLILRDEYGMNAQAAAEALDVAERDERLEVFFVNEHIVWSSGVIFDPTEDSARVFHAYYDEDSVQCIELPRDDGGRLKALYKQFEIEYDNLRLRAEFGAADVSSGGDAGTSLGLRQVLWRDIFHTQVPAGTLSK